MIYLEAARHNMASVTGTLLHCVLILLLTAPFSSCFMGRDDGYRRKVSLELNPGLPPSLTLPPGVGLLHARAQGLNDTLHFLFCSQGAPTLLLVHTSSSSSSVLVDWPVFLTANTSGSLRVEPQSSILYSNAVVFTRLWEYDDANDTADPSILPPSSFLPPYELQDFTWADLNSTLDPVSHSALLCGGDGGESFSNGSLCLKFSAFEAEGRDQGWPRLLHNANSSQISWWLDGVKPRSNGSRFSLELQSVGGAYPMSRVDVLRSIDDEYTPSIFKVSQWVVSPSNSSSSLIGYTQWKPVAYRRAQPLFEDATPCHHSPPVPLDQPPASGLVRAFYKEGSHSPTTGLNITFSISGDPYYNTTNYLRWTALVGLGSAPVDSFSPLVLTIMAVGLGTPLLLILLGGVWVCIRRKATPTPAAYEPIN